MEPSRKLGVELDAGLGGEDLEDAAGLGVDHAGGRAERAATVIEDEVVIVAAAQPELLLGLGDALADGVRGAEVEGGPLDAAELVGGDEAGVHRGEAVRVDGHMVAEDVSGAAAGQVKVGDC